MGWIILIGALASGIYAAVSLSDRRYKKTAGELFDRLRDYESESLEHIRLLKKDLNELAFNREFSNLLDVLISQSENTLKLVDAIKSRYLSAKRVDIPHIEREVEYVNWEVRHVRRALFVVGRATGRIKMC